MDQLWNKTLRYFVNYAKEKKKMKSLLSSRIILSLFIASAVLLTTLSLTSDVVAQSSCGATYTVLPGDYLMKIARICGVSYSDLLKANPTITSPSLTFPGQVINIPASTTTTAGQPGVYTVKTGDTLFSIGQHFNLTVTDLREANPSVSSTIFVGQVLNIPARILFVTGGTSAIVQGQLATNGKLVYLLNASAGQTLEVTLTSPLGLTLAITGADGSTLQSASSNSTFRGVLPKTQDYILTLVSGSSATNFGMTVAIPQRIQFAAGGTSATLSGTVPTNLSQFFILNAAKGQTLNVSATPADQLQLIIYGVDGSVLSSGMGQGASFSGVLPSTQDYFLVLRSPNPAQAFTLNVSVPAAVVPVTGTSSYTVQRGDTLFSIAVRFQTTVAILMRANPAITNMNVITVGQVIFLPGATLTMSNGQVVYIAKSSDSMSVIARLFNTTLSALIGANPQISNPNLIFTGQRINIP
jgi:LysM repeat protein